MKSPRMSNVSPSKEKFCSLISEIIGNSTDIIVEKETVLDFDAVELTLLIKSIGFQLVSLDFDSTPTEGAREIEVDIKCKESGIHSKLLMSAEKCTCPTRKAVNNNSFWEVQGIAPSTPLDKNKGIIQDTSCNLLPDVSKKTTNLAKTMLTVLLQHYQADFEPKGEQIKTIDVKQLVDRLQEKIANDDKPTESGKVSNNEKSTIAEKPIPTKDFISPGDKGETKSHCSTPLSSMNVTPVPSSYDNTTEPSVPKILLHNSSDNVENILIENEKPPETCSQNPSESIEILATTPTQNEATFEKLNAESERDVCLIQAITDARKQLDSALLMLKCNLTRNLSQNSILTVTPQVTKKPPTPKKETLFQRPANRRLSADAIELRRHSYGARQEVKSKINTGVLKTSSSSGSVNDIKKKVLNVPLTGKIAKPDTPRPIVPKKSMSVDNKPVVVSKIAIKRTTSATNLKGTTSASKLAKNPTNNKTPNVAKKL